MDYPSYIPAEYENTALPHIDGICPSFNLLQQYVRPEMDDVV